MATYGFDEQSVKRIGKTVRLSEKFPQKVTLGGPDRSGANPGVRIMLAERNTTAEWTKGTTNTVTVYGGPPGGNGRPTNAAGTVTCWNILATIDANPTATTAARWVQVSNNGFAWYAIGVECL